MLSGSKFRNPKSEMENFCLLTIESRKQVLILINNILTQISVHKKDGAQQHHNFRHFPVCPG
jgi:hypothetical protein